jgi:hypothetical protein
MEALRPPVFPPEWYTPQHLFVKASIIAYYGVCVSLPLATSARLLALNVLFLWNLRTWPVIPVTNIIRVRLRKVTDLYMFTALTWFAGVSLFGVVFFQELDLAAVTIIGLLSILGILTFLVPQWIFRTYLFRSYRLACDMTLAALNNALGIELRENARPIGSIDFPYDISNLKDLANFVGAVSKPSFWVYDPEDFAAITLGQVVAFVSVFFQDSFHSLIHQLFP